MREKTTIEVRVIAAGGKFLGNDIGGAEVSVRDAVTGEWVASGRVRGDSGVTGDIIASRPWGTPVPVAQSSVFTSGSGIRNASTPTTSAGSGTWSRNPFLRWCLWPDVNERYCYQILQDDVPFG